MKKVILIIVITILAAGGYYFGFNRGREKEILSSRQQIQNLQNQLLDQQEIAKSSKPKPTQTKGAATNKKTDNTTSKDKIHVVQDGETLFTIGLKYNILWTRIAEANDITENTALFVGQKLKIPSDNDKNTTTEKVTKITIDLTKAQEEQKLLNEKNINTWQLDPIEVVRREAPTDLNLSPGDPFSLLSKDLSKGMATVYLQSDEKSYTFYLAQPIDKGDKGIWKIQKIMVN